MRGGGSWNQGLLAAFACTALFAAAPAAWSAPAPTLTTTASPDITLSDSVVSLSDSAELSGGLDPTGTLIFTLTGPGGFVFTEANAVTGNGTFTAETTAPTTGTVVGPYVWTATYSGDANNNGANDQGGTAEQTVISAAAPTLDTTASLAGSTLTDSAVLSGGYFPAGVIVFTLTGPGGFVFTELNSVTGNGTYTADTPLPADAVAGAYSWFVDYTGDGNNAAASASVEPISVGGVPGPSTWVLTGLGFAGLGSAAFRRSVRRQATALPASLAALTSSRLPVRTS